MQIITVNVNKGGAGKTTFTHNFAEYLRKNYRVLVLDFDDSANLTSRYGQFHDLHHTIIELFDHGVVEPIAISKNLDLIAGHREVELLKERVQSKRRREYLFGKWLAQNIQELQSKYDYILIDTENDEGILTQNAIITSDLVVGIAEPHKDNVTALANLRSFVNDLNADFDMNTQLVFVANKINRSKDNSKELLKSLSKFTEYAGYLPDRTLIADDVAIFNKKVVSKKNAQDVEHVSELFEVIRKKVEGEV
ncbi:AAA domain-containing protein [Pilibacter termitis]|uniref:AAA domain-containing protein n=1 Tax=Pilibacter termitis TaxID=263852 RepID=A0A1T4KRQ6_9ENTE|nr:ParA family protein [Pilibacter termitis]SJZ45105.1 AAA domain-containing protein [Pilibacter termitis]